MAGTPILVVDDAPVNLKLMRLLLTHEGYEVRTAERAEDALKMLSNYRPELIMADIQLPGMSGLDMARKVKEDPRTSAITVVALTACAMKEDQERALRAGCDDYISKPIDTTTLPSKVRELLARSAAREVGPPHPVADNEASSFSGPEIETLRRRFLKEGAEISRQLAASLDSTFDAVRVAKHLHEWAGSAALLGHPEISILSRQAEELLREEPVRASSLRDVLTDLLFTFEELRDSKSAPALEPIVQATTGKRIALIGFTTECADTMCAALERGKARARLFDAADDPDSEAIRCCDLVIFHVRPETLQSPWMQPGVFAPVKRLVFAGKQDDLIALPRDIRSRAVDFLVDREGPDEILMRVAFAVSQAEAVATDGDGVAAEVAPAVPVRPRPAVAHPSIVLADDDDIVLAMVGPTLQNYGMSCRSVDNGIEALRLIRSEQPHVAVVDVNMPGMDGFEVLAAVRAESLPTRVILLSARQHERDILRAFDLGADDYLIKPFNPFELVARVKRLLR